ncbi:MAG: peptidase M50 [Demequinaceae bacterium]|nr:peptidase M50 [Demequinaceae bacterium]
MLAVSLVGSVLLHEVAHAIAARAFGRKVSEIVLTLWGGHTSFDATGITPLVNGVTALAGPAMNLVIAGVARLVLAVADVGGLAGDVLAYVAWANVLLAAFNVLPGIPMDGGRVLESIVWGVTRNRNKGTLAAAWMGRVVAIAVVAYSFASPILQGRRPGITDIVVALIIFSVLWPAASSAITYSRTMMRRDGLTVAALMVPAVGVPYTATVEESRRIAATAGVTEIVVLGADDVPAGRFPLELTDQVPPEAREDTSLQSVTTPIPRGAAVEQAAAADVLIPELRQWWGKTDVLVVVDGTSVVGILRLVDVVAALS